MHARLSQFRRGVLAALAAAAVLPAAAQADPAPFFDVRTTASPSAAAAPGPAPQRVAPDRGVRQARADLERRLGEQGVLDVDPVTGTARSVQRLDGALTGPQPGAPRGVALDYVRAHAAALGLGAPDLDTLVPAGERRSPSGAVTVHWTQAVGGIPAFDNGLTVTVDRDGRVVTVFGSPRADLPRSVGEPAISATDALRAAMDDVSASGPVRVTEEAAGPRRHTTFEGDHEARLVLFGDAGTVRLAWRVLLLAAPDAAYDTIVDAADGRILRRANLMKADDSADVYPGWPGNPATPLTIDLAPWLYTPAEQAEEEVPDTTFGPNVWAWADVNGDDAATVSELARRNPALGDSFRWPLTDFTPTNADGNCAAAFRCTWDDDVPLSWKDNQDATIVNSFYLANRFHDHLEAAPIGFDEDDGNFEGDDPLFLNALDGAATGPDALHINNANMLTYPDGGLALMQMYLASTRGTYLQRDVSYDFDPATVWHEYTHGLSNRLVVDADGWGALSSPQAGAMGEGWSDFYALDKMATDAIVADTAADGEVSLGAYPDPVPNETRKQFIDCSVGSAHANCPGGGFTYADFGQVGGRGPEVHDDGEIWAQTLWDLRKAIGSHDALLLVTEGMRQTPPEPSFLDARNGILAAVTATGRTELRDDVWQVFAGRGMGFYAGATSGSDVTPVANDDLPPADDGPTGTATGRIVDADTGTPVAGVEVGLGGHSGSGGFSDVTGADGRYTLEVPAGDYPSLYVRAPGYDPPASVPPTVSVAAGAESTLADLAVRRSWAMLTGGATLEEPPGGSCGRAGALDGSQGTGWSQPRPGGAFDQPDDPPVMTITLPRAVDVSALAIDPTEACGDDETAALGEILVEASTGGGFTPLLSETFDASDRGQLTSYAPEGPAAGVTRLRVTLVESQNPAGSSGKDWIDLTELRVYGTPASTPSGGGGGGTPPPPVEPAPDPAPADSNPTPPVAPPPLAPAGPPITTDAVLPRTGTAGRVTARVTCASRCRVRAELLAGRRLARRLGTGRRLARANERLAAGDRGRVTVRLRRKQRRELRRLDRDDRVALTLVVTVTGADGEVTRERRRVRVRV